MTDMRRRKQGDRVLNKTPKWVLDGLQQMETDDPKGTSEILIELNEYRSLQGDKYYTTGRYYGPHKCIFTIRAQAFGVGESNGRNRTTCQMA